MSTTLEAVQTEPEARLSFGRLHRFTPEQYMEMIRLGIITDDDRCELLEGVVVAKMGKNPPHVGVTHLIFAALFRLLPEGWSVTQEAPFRTTDSLPEPDCAVLRGSIRDYMQKTPDSTDLAFVVEVSNTSLARDRGRKRRAYARAGIPIYWLANLKDGRLEYHTDPTGPDPNPAYRKVEFFGPDDSVPVVIEGREIGRIAVRDIFP